MEYRLGKADIGRWVYLGKCFWWQIIDLKPERLVQYRPEDYL